MQLIGIKQKKFWTPSLILPPTGKVPAGALTITYVSEFTSSNGPAGTTLTQPFTWPTVPAGAVIAFAFLCQNGAAIPSSIVIDPGGAAISLAAESSIGATPPTLWSGVAAAGLAAGSKNFTVTVPNNTMQFQFIAVHAWILAGQLTNTAIVGARSANNVSGLSVSAGQGIIGASCHTSNQTWAYSNSTPVVPSATHGTGTVSGAAEWNTSATTTASYTIVGQFGLNPSLGSIAATYL